DLRGAIDRDRNHAGCVQFAAERRQPDGLDLQLHRLATSGGQRDRAVDLIVLTWRGCQLGLRTVMEDQEQTDEQPEPKKRPQDLVQGGSGSKNAHHSPPIEDLLEPLGSVLELRLWPLATRPALCRAPVDC